MPLARSSASVISTSSQLFILLSCKLVLALPTESPSHSNSTERTSAIDTSRTGLVRFGALGLGSLHLVAIAGIIYIIIRFTMPKSVKERRLDREYKVSPREARHGQCSNVQEKDQITEKSMQVPGEDINKIWIDAVRKGNGPEAIGSGDESDDKQGAPNTINHSLTLSRTLSHNRPILPPITFRNESYNFGENPNYHDEAFQYNPTYQTASVSTPSSPFSSRFYSVNIRKVKGHKRSRSSPLSSPYQTLQAIGFQSDANPTPQFPLPTLRPTTPPQTMSTSETPLLASDDEEPFNSTTVCRYTKQYPQKPQADSLCIRDHSTPPPDSCENVPNTNTALSIIEGTRWSNNTNNSGQDGTFQPVMIFEQGQSVTGQKWKRKVTVFRSDVLERLEQEGLVLY